MCSRRKIIFFLQGKVIIVSIFVKIPIPHRTASLVTGFISSSWGCKLWRKGFNVLFLRAALFPHPTVLPLPPQLTTFPSPPTSISTTSFHYHTIPWIHKQKNQVTLVFSGWHQTSQQHKTEDHKCQGNKEWPQNFTREEFVLQIQKQQPR